MALLPNNELVAVSWLQVAVPYLGQRVSTALPVDNSTWAASGFTTVSAQGGDADSILGWRRPVFSVDTWGAVPTSGKPPWHIAGQLVEQVREAVIAHAAVPRTVTMPTGYRGAFVRQAQLISEPRRIPGDAASYAHYNLSMSLWWVAKPE